MIDREVVLFLCLLFVIASSSWWFGWLLDWLDIIGEWVRFYRKKLLGSPSQDFADAGSLAIEEFFRWMEE